MGEEERQQELSLGWLVHFPCPVEWQRAKGGKETQESRLLAMLHMAEVPRGAHNVNTQEVFVLAQS